MRRLGLVIVLAACGRVGFDPSLDPARCGSSSTLPIQLGATADGVLCKGEVDTYSVSLAAGEELQIDLATDGPGWLTLEMVDDAQNVRALRTLEPTLSGFADHDGAYVVRVAGTAARAGTPYHLTVARRAGTYVFMAPTGADVNDGTFARPFKTFAKAKSLLGPGVTLVLLDGDYLAGQAGRIDIDCTMGINGAAGAPIRIVALTERRAALYGDGLDPPIRLGNNCSYWSIEGIHAESKDAIGNATNGSVIAIDNSSHMTVKRVLLRKNNRNLNSHLLVFGGSSDVLVEDFEGYDFHAAGILLYGTTRATVRRAFVASRGNADINGGTVTDPPDKGDEGVANNHAVDSVIENTIAEGNGEEGNYGAGNIDCVGTRVLGAIALHDDYGFISSVITPGTQNTIGARYENAVAIGSRVVNFYIRSNMDAVCTACTSLDSQGTGWDADQLGPQPRVSSAHCINCLASRDKDTGILVQQQTGGWSVENSNSFGNGVSFDPMPAPELMSPMSLDPQLGGCLVYLPATSPMRGAGKGGATIGAEILYRYRDGVLTSTPLWDPETGAYPCGAVVAGVNDNPATSCSGIHERLHVGTNNCVLPYPAL